jgi:hypothetical protein
MTPTIPGSDPNRLNNASASCLPLAKSNASIAPKCSNVNPHVVVVVVVD